MVKQPEKDGNRAFGTDGIDPISQGNQAIEAGTADNTLLAAAGRQGVSKEDVALYAHYCRQLVIEYKDGVNKNLWQLAKVMKEIRDEKLYRPLACSTFNEFIAQPEIGMSRSAVYALIKRYEIYSNHLNVPENRLLSIDSSKLDIIAPVVESDPEKWLELAGPQGLSQGDLINEVRIAQGRGEMSPLPPSSSVSASAPFSTYEEYVRRQPCCICGSSECDASDYAHFPRTKAAGGKFGIPMCRRCHTEFDNSKDPGKWIWDNRFGWGRHLDASISIFIQSIGRGDSE